MRISKESARTVSLQLTEKKMEEINKIKSEIGKLATSVYKKTIPKKVLEAFETHKNWINKTSNIYATGRGLNHQWINLGIDLPSSHGSNPAILFDNESADKLVKLINLLSEKKDQRDVLRDEIEAALLSLGSYAKIQAEFKEAAEFLPFKPKSELVVNLKDIRAKL